MPTKISAGLRAQVRVRAGFLCEYCHTQELWQYIPFFIDHIIPIAKLGLSTLKNLALACPHCNRRKSDHLFAVDPFDQTEVPLFNPREHRWEEHFIWSFDGARIVPLTAIGRAAVELLQLNNARRVRIRAEDVKVNRHPPLNDPIQTAN